MTKQEHQGFGIAVPLSLFLIMGLYVGSYLCLAEPTPTLSDAQAGEGLVSSVEADYIYDGEWARRVFAPLEWLDRRLFPNRWQFNVEISPAW